MKEISNQEKKFSLLKIWQDKRLRAILISSAIILICALIYVVLLFTVLKTEEKEVLPTEGNHGEEMVNGRPFVIDPVESDRILSIDVENEFGGFRYYLGDDDQYYFENAEFMFYDQNTDFTDEEASNPTDVLSSLSMVDSLVSLARYMLATEEVVGYDKANLSAYGLEGRGQAAITLTYLNEKDEEVSKTAFIGKPTVSGSGYYVMAEGREALYIVADNYLSKCIFTDVKAYLLPRVALPASSTEYTDVKELVIKKKGEVFASLRDLTDEEYKEAGELFTHVFTHPEGYYPSTENLQSLLETFVSFSGEEVIEYDIAKRLSDPEQAQGMLDLFHHYSLMDAENRWNYELYYQYKDFDTTLYISEKLEVTSDQDGENAEKHYIYYIYSPDFDLIAEFDATELKWVEWDMLDLLDNHSFSVPIDNVSSMEFSFEDTYAKFSLQGEKDGLKVTSSSGVKVDTDNFRQLYKAVLFTTMDGYASKPEEADEILKLNIVLRDGNEYHYVFYGMTARKAYYSLNGSGEFYINRDYVKQMMTACNDILSGKTVIVDRKN